MGKNSGFTFMEVLVAVSLVLLFSAGVAMAFTTVVASGRVQYNVQREARLLLEVDHFLRAKAAMLCIPYWENPFVIAQVWAQDLLQKRLPSGAEYIEVRIVSDSKNRVRGASVTYRINEREYETVCLFASAGVVFE